MIASLLKLAAVELAKAAVKVAVQALKPKPGPRVQPLPPKHSHDKS